MPAPKNTLKAALAAGPCQSGLWLNLASGLTAEIAGQAGFDWCLIDAEHAPYDPTVIQAQLTALAATGTPAVVRAPAGEAWMLKQLLDMGAQSLMVPMVDTADQARALVRAVRYPPDGIRGNGAAIARASRFGAEADYLQTANAQICLIVQIETQAALENLDEICAVDGVDCVFVGPADLACDMGYQGDASTPEVDAAIDSALARIHAHGKASGIIAFAPEGIAKYRRMGVSFLGVGSDLALLSSGLRGLRAALR